jgi:signal transduction histidine kinase
MKTALNEGRIKLAEFEMPDGRNFERSYTPVAEGDAQQRVVALLRDVTEKKAATAAIMRAEQLAALGELAAGVAHEINNPINGIINYAQILVNTTKEGDRVHEIAARVIKEGDRIAKIVEGLLSFARRRQEDKSVISINQILADSMALTAAQLRSDNIIVNMDIPDNLPDVRVQAHEIEQVFVNIISNARHALNEKYPGLHEDKILDVAATTISSMDNHFIRVSFRDNGTGIPANIIDKVMLPFFSTKPGRKRTGLGLSISHGILDEHGGKLIIESEEGKYTKVIMELPALQKTKH